MNENYIDMLKYKKIFKKYYNFNWKYKSKYTNKTWF